MPTLEDIKAGVQIAGIIPNQPVTVVSVQQHGPDAITVFYTRLNGQPGSQLLFRADEARIQIIETPYEQRFSATGDLLRLASEAYRIHLAHLFDPVLAVHTSLIEPLPHQITAVYGEMLTRQPLRYLLADDPGAGKTVMAGLLIKELIIRGDVRRCLICVPGNLCEQWQDELWQKFQIPFQILTRETINTSHTGNPFTEHDLLIVRLDQVSRDDDLQRHLRKSDWDLIICDEAHKLSASFFGGELKETKRYRLGKLLSELTRHFLLMTATPHNGKEEDFQLFMALLDPDRFEGRFRDGVHVVDTSDLMRRIVKENLLKFDGRPLFPERRAYTVDYELSEPERDLYEAVTAYVRDEFNRAEQLEQGGRKGTVGFALTVLQRRLASSPEAIYQSLHRRCKRLEKRLQEARQTRYSQRPEDVLAAAYADDWEALDDLPSDELETLESEVIDSATAAQTIAELEAEIAILRDLEEKAAALRRLGTDRKWEELRTLLLHHTEMVDPERGRHKLVIFTEHRDTLNYLAERIAILLGNGDGIVIIHGGMRRAERRQAEDRFRNEPEALILLATDAAGEGINLQRAHLMVNYDLPWNPNRLEQRFGRIHRIGQTEVCHLWNMVAGETREGHVYQRLLKKLETERHALRGQVFDVLGKLFEEAPLRQLLIEAIRYGDRPDVRARLEQAIDNAVDQERVRRLLERRSLAQNTLDVSEIVRIREDMERAAARRLQPHYIKSFFLDAFQRLGGTIYEREPGRYQITHVPLAIRDRAREIAVGQPVARSYERVCFEKGLITVPGRPLATFICPGHPLLDATIDLTLERHRAALQGNAVLIDPTDPGDQPRMLFYLEQNLQDATQLKDGGRRVVSREVHFVEIDSQESIRAAGSAPYLDYRAATADDLEALRPRLEAAGLVPERLEAAVTSFAIQNLIPGHLERVRTRREQLVDKTLQAVQERLTKEINYWDRKAQQLRERERAGKPDKLNSARAQARADELAERLKRRKQELELERQISATPPVLIGRAVVVPAGMLLERVPAEMLDRQITEQIAMQAVMQAEIALGNDPKDVSAEKRGYDIESRDRQTGQLRFIEVKGRRAGADTVTLTRNELLTALNAPERFILALVEVEDGQAREPRYVRRPLIEKDLPFGATSVNFDLRVLLADAAAVTAS